MPPSYRFITPETRFRRIEQRLAREQERKQAIDQAEQRRKQFRAAEEQSIQSQLLVEQQRSQELDRRDQLEGRQRFQEIEGELQPRTFQPSPSPSGVFRDDLNQPSRFALEPFSGQLPEEFRLPERVRPGLGGFVEVGERAERQFYGPIAARGLQLAESPVGQGFLGVPELKTAQRRLEDIGVPEEVSPLPRTRGFEQVFGDEAVDPFKAIAGDREEQEKAQAVLEEAGFPRALTARVIFDLTNLLPGAGFTRLDDFARLVTIATRSTGRARQAAVTAVRESEVAQTALRGIREAPEAGAARLGGEELGGFPQRFKGRQRKLEGGPPETPIARSALASEPEPPRLPTVREVEARARPLPPKVRAQIMGEIEGTDIPLMGWDEFHGLWGERFQQNWWTKLEDTVRGPLARTGEERAIRSFMVKGDLYRNVQKIRMRAQVWAWAGRHRQVLGLDSRGFARNINPQPGADIPERAVQRLDHITEHPEKYLINPEQQIALDDAQQVFAQTLQKELVEGVEIEPLIQDYWRRIVVKDPSGKRVKDAMGLRLPRVRPEHAKTRVFGDIEELFKRGYTLDDPLPAMTERLETAADTIANRRIVDEIRNVGIKPSERVSQELIDEANEAREAFKAARVAAKRGGSAERATLVEAETRLVDAKRALRLDAKKAAERRPRLFGRIVTDAVMDEASRYLDLAGPNAIEEAFRLGRASLITGDFSAMLIQGWTTFWADHPTWWMANARSLEAMARNPLEFVVKNIDAVESGTRFGAIVTPEEFLLRRGGKFTQRFGRLPGVRQFQRSFEWWTFVAQTLRWKTAMRMAENTDDLLELAAVLRAQTGVTLLPGLTARQRRLSQIFFAPKYSAAILNQVKQMARSGPAGEYARKTMGMAFGGALASIIAGNIALGQKPNLTDPDSAGFMGIRIGKGYIFPLGPFQPIAVVLFRTGRGAEATARGDTPSVRDLQAWPRFLEGKLNVYERWIVRAAEALGAPIGKIRGRPFQGPEFGAGREGAIGEIPAPIGVEQAVRGIREGAPITGVEFLGGRATVETLAQAFERKTGRQWEETPRALRDEIIRGDADLSRLQGRRPETESERVRGERNEALLPHAEAVLNDVESAGPHYNRQRSGTMVRFAGVSEEVFRDLNIEPEGRDQELVAEYYDIDFEEDRNSNGLEGDDEDVRLAIDDRERLLEQMSPDVASAIQNPANFFEGDVLKVEQMRDGAIEALVAITSLSRYQELSLKESEEVEETRQLIRQTRDRLKRDASLQGLEPEGISFRLVAMTIARKNPEKETRIAQAIMAERGDAPLNPERIQLALDNQELLSLFYPRFLAGLLPAEIERTELSEQAFERVIAR